MTLKELQILFPKSGQNSALTGLIPIDWFQQHEKEIAQLCRDQGLRRIYRGPRSNRWGTSTLKAQAKNVLLYLR